MENVMIKTRTASGKWIFAIAFTVLFQLTILASDTDPGDFGGGDNPTDETPVDPPTDFGGGDNPTDETPVDPPTDFGGGNNPTDAPAAPIDDYLFVLLATAIGYAFYKYKAFGKQTKVESIL